MIKYTFKMFTTIMFKIHKHTAISYKQKFCMCICAVVCVHVCGGNSDFMAVRAAVVAVEVLKVPVTTGLHQ
jgi:uncharacterized membrane protein YbaN (DUF454 family)